MHGIERRFAPANLEVREAPDGSVGIKGYAAIFDYESYGEVVRSSAFNKTLADGADVRMLLNHEGVPLARTKSGTLMLSVDEVGLAFDVPALDMTSPLVQQIVSAIRRGDLAECSFAFRVIRDQINEAGVRELLEVALVDVSVVTFPWYDATTVDLKADDRELVEARSDDDAAEARDDSEDGGPLEGVDPEDGEELPEVDPAETEERDPKRNLKRLALAELRRRAV